MALLRLLEQLVDFLGGVGPVLFGIALLLAPPDNAGPNFPAEAPTFTAVEATPLHVPGLVVSSDDDPYCSPEVASRLAAGWRLHHVSVGSAGHINSASGLGRWDSGRELLARLP
ncbi:RBBP9/YdeN family alpha/beta hydrolase [Nonomuraea sp. NPDC003201]